MSQKSHRVEKGLWCRAHLYLATTILTGMLPADAFGQIQSLIPDAPIRPAVDEAGVDVIRGQANVAYAGASIGPAGDGGLSYRQYWTGTGWRDNLVASVTSQGSGNTYTVSFGNTTDVFTWDGAAFTGTEGRGTSLGGGPDNPVYTARDGTIVYFNRVSPDEDEYQINLARVSQVIKPSGEQLKYVYQEGIGCNQLQQADCYNSLSHYYRKRARLRWVDSSFGYTVYMTYGYEGPVYNVQQLVGEWLNLSKVTLFNRSQENCYGTVNPCIFQNAWPTLSFTRGNDGKLSITDSLGRSTRFSVTNGKLVGIKSPAAAGDDTVISYDSSGRVSKIVRDGLERNYAYSDSGDVRTTVVTGPSGYKVVYTGKLSTNRILSVSVFSTDIESDTTRFEYDILNRPTATIGPDGLKTQYVYDGRGNVTETHLVAKGDPAGVSHLVSRASFDVSCIQPSKCNKPNFVTDARGNVTDFEYDNATGQTKTITAPADSRGVRPQTRFKYDGLHSYYLERNGQVTPSTETMSMLSEISRCQTSSECAGTIDETKTTVQFGVAGEVNNLLPTLVTVAAGKGPLSVTTAIVYDTIGNPISVDGPKSGNVDTTNYRYDAGRQLVGIISPDPDGLEIRQRSAVKMAYDPNGRVKTRSTGRVADASDAAWNNYAEHHNLTMTYGADGKLTREILSGSGIIAGVVDFLYDDGKRLSCTVQYMDAGQIGPQASTCKPYQTVGLNGPDRVTSRSYDNAGRLTQVTTGIGTSALSVQISAAYTSSSKTSSVVDGNGNITKYLYDSFDRLASVTYPGGSIESYAYDDVGNVIEKTQRDGSIIQYAYDRLNRMSDKTLPGEGKVDYKYNLSGLLASVSKSGSSVEYTYNALNMLVSERQPFGVVTSEYDASGNRIKLQGPDDFFVNYDYDVLGNILGIREKGAASGPANLITYRYDDYGNRVAVERANGITTKWKYDVVGRVSEVVQGAAGSPGYAQVALERNMAGQITSRTRGNLDYAWTSAVSVDRPYLSNSLNQHSNSGSVALGYDRRGNVTSSGSITYSYSSENMMTGANNGVALLYDPAGRLNEVQASATTRFLYDGARAIAELDSVTNAVIKRYVYGADLDEPLVYYDGAGLTDPRWMLADERGSIVATSNKNGEVLTINSYDEFGIPGSKNTGRFQFTGQMWIGALGLYNYRARMYSVNMGRFMQADPLGYADSLNTYAYAGNDPINITDPFGLCGEVVGGNASDFIGNPSGTTTVSGCRRSDSYGSFATLIAYNSVPIFQNTYDPGYNIGTPTYLIGNDARPLAPQNVESSSCNQRRLDLANALAAAGDSFDSAGDKALIGAGGVAVAGAVFGATGIGLPVGVTAETVAAGLATAGTITKGVGSVLSVGAHVVAIGATGDYSLAGPAIFSGVAGILPFGLGPVASYFQDKVSSAASQTVGFGNIPSSCPR